MSTYIVGTKHNGERLRFERWVYDAWRQGHLSDPLLLGALASCTYFSEE